MKRIPRTNLFFDPELDNGNIAIVTRRRRPVGNIWWRPTGKYTVEIEHLAIDDFYQNRGLGEKLLREFAANISTLYPKIEFVPGNATSRGMVRLLRKVFGRERERINLLGLPRKAPENWMATHNRVHVRFKAGHAVTR